MYSTLPAISVGQCTPALHGSTAQQSASILITPVNDRCISAPTLNQKLPLGCPSIMSLHGLTPAPPLAVQLDN